MWKKKPNPSAVLLFGITLALFFSPTVPSASNPWSWIAWFALVVVSERLWHHTIDNRGLFTMGPVIAVPTLALVPPPVGPVIVISGALLATMLFRRTMRTAWVYLGMVAVSSCVLVLLLQFALGWSWSPTESLGVKEVVFMAGAALLYLGLLQGGTSFVRARGMVPLALRQWKSNFWGGTERIASAAMVLMAVLEVFCALTLGFRGFALCIMPIMFIWDGSRRYSDLKRAQALSLDLERHSARGQIAAETGHEINNYLMAISGRAQLMEMSDAVVDDDAKYEQVHAVRELAIKMSNLARGLMDFSHQEAKCTPYPINELLEKTVEFMRAQGNFKTVNIDLSGDPVDPIAEIDPAQIQQALFTLLKRCAYPAREGRPVDLRIVTSKDSNSVAIRIQRTDAEAAAGMGEGKSVQGDPTLGTVSEIVNRHHGRFEATGPGKDQGEWYEIILPAA